MIVTVIAQRYLIQRFAASVWGWMKSHMTLRGSKRLLLSGYAWLSRQVWFSHNTFTAN